MKIDQMTEVKFQIFGSQFLAICKKFSKDFIEDELYAKQNKFGMWKGKFLEPSEWRRLNR